jgi:EAL domain-containing protein (putative c-di-GMP-specific phosphodiesterase class I)
MYRAKGRGKRTYEVFEASMHAAALERLEMEHDLRQAIERGELAVQYQPIVWIESGQMSGVEALIRWPHPTKGMIPPDRFIPLAEETGLIVPLGMFVLERACADAAAWEAMHPDNPLRIGVNLSVRQLGRPNIAGEIRSVLKRTGISPERITLEITESAVMREGDETAAKLQRLRSAGLKIAIDDFGTGYSSLSYLARFPIDMIKIDKAFVRQVGRGAKNSALLRAIVGLGHSLGVEIVAEGIETAAQAKVLEPLGCRGQGYFYSKPVASERILELMAEPSIKPVEPARRKEGDARPVLELLESS